MKHYTNLQPMDFSSNTDREALRKGVGDVVRRFGDEDWLGRHDEER